MLRAVLDANVFVSAALSPAGPPGRVLRGFLTGERIFTLIMSPEILDETRRAIAYPRVRTLIARDLDADGWILDLFSLSEVVEDTGRSAGRCSDPDDDRYIAAAIEGRASFVMTGDRALLALDGIDGVGIITPRAFLDLLER